MPIYKGIEYENDLREIKKHSKDFNDERDNVVHIGRFKVNNAV